MSKKLKVGVIFGGRSSEHEISLISAQNIIEALDKDKYEVIPIGITREGRWLLGNSSELLLNSSNPKLVKLNQAETKDIALVSRENSTELVNLENGNDLDTLDVVFPVFHGVNGEDGAIQGLLKMANLPFVGCDILGSAVGMDKDVMKRLLRDAHIPIAKFITFYSPAEVNFDEVTKEFGLPLFVKPANTGSSIGISKAHDEKEFDKAVKEAFRYDKKIVIEEAIQGREIEVSVLGNENPLVSLPGEVIPHHEFYDFEAKYIDENGAALEIPAKLSDDLVVKIQEIAIKTFKVLCGEGMARVDGFLTESGEFVINEVNTIPGFTKISMYPKLWEATGVSYTKLLDKLIELAIESKKRADEIEANFLRK